MKKIAIIGAGQVAEKVHAAYYLTKPETFQLVAVVFGAIFYRAVLTVALQLGLPSGDLKLLSAVLVVIAIASANMKRRRS